MPDVGVLAYIHGPSFVVLSDSPAPSTAVVLQFAPCSRQLGSKLDLKYLGEESPSGSSEVTAHSWGRKSHPRACLYEGMSHT